MQVKLIRAEGEKQKIKIANVSKHNGDKVAQYLGELVGKREQLNAKILEAIEHITSRHSVDIVEGFDTRTAEMKSLTEMKINQLPGLSIAYLERTGRSLCFITLS